MWDRRIKNGLNEGLGGFPLEAESLAAGRGGVRRKGRVSLPQL